MADSSRCYRTSSGKRMKNLDRRSVVDRNEAEKCVEARPSGESNGLGN